MTARHREGENPTSKDATVGHISTVIKVSRNPPSRGHSTNPKPSKNCLTSSGLASTGSSAIEHS